MAEHGEHTAYDRILEHFRAGGSLSPLEALRLFGCMRLAAVVHRMRERDKVPIVSREEQGEDGRRWARYHLGLDKAKAGEDRTAYFERMMEPDPILQAIPFMEAGPGKFDVAAKVLEALPGKEMGLAQLPGVPHGYNRP